jgi:hypothetical protein
LTLTRFKRQRSISGAFSRSSACFRTTRRGIRSSFCASVFGRKPRRVILRLRPRWRTQPSGCPAAAEDQVQNLESETFAKPPVA